MCVNAVVCVPLSRSKCSSYYLNLSFFLYVLEQQVKEYYHNNSIKKPVIVKNLIRLFIVFVYFKIIVIYKIFYIHKRAMVEWKI